MKPKIIVTVEGGCVQGILTNMAKATEVIVINYDEKMTGHKVDRRDVNVGEFAPEFMPDHVDALIAGAEENRRPEEVNRWRPATRKPVGEKLTA